MIDVPAEFDQIIEYQAGLPDAAYFSTLAKNSLIIIDDMMSECGNSDVIMKLFSAIARKRNISIIFIVQNVYDRSKQFRNIRINATGFVLFKFYAATDVTKRIIRDMGITSLISKKQIERIYNENFAYIMINIHPKRHSAFSTITANIFDKYFNIFHKMEYVVIPKEEFIKYFKVIEAKKGTVKAVKNEITLPKSRKPRKPRKRKRSPTPHRGNSTTATESSTDSDT